MVLVSFFLVNWLCAMVPCDTVNDYPEIRGMPRSSSLNKGIREKRLIPSGESSYYPIVSTRNGLLQGFPMMVMSGRWIAAFEGIQYAHVPGRFLDSVPVRNWAGIKTAFAPGPYCLQLHVGKYFRLLGSEHSCLNLNIYVPKHVLGEGRDQKNSKTKLLNVIVFIHGGSFAFGAGHEFGPSYLLEKDVILVSMNYRLGVLGFMSTGDSNSPGNYGLKDQQLALKWVHENIKNFGGNPDKVTLMGQSAGSVSTHLHMMNDQSRTYFRRAILLSGSAFNHWSIQSTEQALRWTHDLAKNVNCPISSNQEIVACFRRMDPNFLVAAQMNLFDWMPFPPVLFAPVLESPSDPGAFITQRPEEIMRNGSMPKIPAIFGQTTQEGLLSNYALNALAKIGSFINNVPKYLPYYLDYYRAIGSDPTTLKVSQIRENVTERILDFYLQDESINPRNISAYTDMGTDRMFTVGIHKAIKYHSKSAPTYASLFSYMGKYNQGTIVGVPKGEMGVAHTEDLYYLFNASLYMQGFKQSDPEAELSKIMVNLVTNFVIKGEPLYTEPKSGKDVRIWDAVTPKGANVEYLQLDKDIGMIDDPFLKRIRLWESLGLRDMQPDNQNINKSETWTDNNLNLV